MTVGLRVMPVDNILLFSSENKTKNLKKLLVGYSCVLFQLIQISHFELVSDKQILMSCFVEMISVAANRSNFLVVKRLREIVKGVLQPQRVALQMIIVGQKEQVLGVQFTGCAQGGGSLGSDSFVACWYRWPILDQHYSNPGCSAFQCGSIFYNLFILNF